MRTTFLGGLLAALVLFVAVPGCASTVRTKPKEATSESPLGEAVGAAAGGGLEPPVTREVVSNPASKIPEAPVARSAPSATNANPDGIEELIARLTELKAKKAAIEQAEGELTALLRERVKQQQKKLQGLGIPAEAGGYYPPAQWSAPAPACAPPAPPAISMMPVRR